MNRLVVAFFIGAFSTAAVNGTEYPFFKQTLPGGIHQDGDAKWEDQAEQSTFVRCGKLPLPTQPPESLSDCLTASLHLKSHAALVMECSLTMEFDRPDDAGRTHIEAQTLIGPDEERWAARSNGPYGIHIVGFSSHCATLPLEPVKALDIPAECTVNVRDPHEEYPMSLRRRQLGGRTIIEYTATKTRQMGELQIVGSSGSALVDNAAIEATKHMRVTTNCVGQRFRYTVTFDVHDPRMIYTPQTVE